MINARWIFGLATLLALTLETAPLRAATPLRAAEPPVEVARSPQRWRALLQELDRATPGSAAAAKLREEVDAAAGQRYGYASRLYWHTDWESATEAAKREGKPILSLRMLGRLTDELSCANSRFFRTALYPNTAISKLMREHYVLHWSSERAVPVLTVDFGDGRVMKRTVTGNSIHYLMSANGKVVDALPGMVSPQTFAHWLKTSQSRYAAGSLNARSLLRETSLSWQIELADIGRRPGPAPASLSPELSAAVIDQQLAALKNSTAVAPVRAPRAEAAVVLARPKYVAEAKFVSELTVAGIPVQSVKDDELWQQLAAKRVEHWRLDEASRELIRSLRPAAVAGGDEAFEEMIRNFENNVAQDDVRNRYVMQWQVRKWIMAGQNDFESLNRRVYNELFLTPREDPYLGLVDRNIFTGLARDGFLK